ncbi:MAG: CPBP family intramembrane glutamic endopeptidase, partial [Chloroflexota bacterium]
RLSALLAPIGVVVIYLGATDPGLQAEYPLAKSLVPTPWAFAALELYYLVYYWGWEFFFRGFMLFGIERAAGPVLAVGVTILASTLAHIGKPSGETFAAIIAGVIGGYVALRTRSILYPILLHWLLGVATDVFVLLRAP